MRRVRVPGLNRLAAQVRQELLGPISEQRRHVLQEQVGQVIRDVEQSLKRRRAQVNVLETNARRAFEFLQSLDLSSPPQSALPAPATPPAASVRFPGLTKRFEAVLDALALQEEDPRQVHQLIQKTSRNIERAVRVKQLTAEQLTAPTRKIRGWMAFFAQPDQYERYLEAVAMARPILEEASHRSRRFRPPARLHFRPIRALYRATGNRSGMDLHLPTPMVSFDREGFEAVAKAMFGKGRDRQAAVTLLTDERAQAIQAELESLGGIVEQTAGLTHDLADSFDRVNRIYWDGQMDRPHLSWSRSFTRRKFGHYDHVHDTVMLSCSLDRPEVPAYVVDFVMYHELLHKHHGIRWKNGRSCVHTTAFKQDEQRFALYHEAEAALEAIARGTL